MPRLALSLLTVHHLQKHGLVQLLQPRKPFSQSALRCML